MSSSSSRVLFRMRPIHRLGLFVGLVLALGVAMPVAAASTHTVTTTQNFHVVQTLDATNPCNGDEVIGPESSNIVQHETYFTTSDEAWFTGTEEDKFTVVDQVTWVTYTGHATGWFGGSINRQNAETGFTQTIKATGSDGSTISFHEVAHETMLPDGTLSVTFDKVNMTCG